MKKLTLMNRTHEVCSLTYDTAAHRFAQLLSVYNNALYAPPGAFLSEATTLSRLNEWWGGRTIPGSRPNIKESLRGLGLATPVALLEMNHGLSLSDQYWVKEQGSSLTWEEINFFNNPFSDDVGRLFFGEKPASQNPDLNSPDNSSDGNLPKRWTIEGTQRILLKSGKALNQEPTNEVIATNLNARLLAPSEYVTYWLYQDGQNVYSACANMLDDDEEYVPALYIWRCIPFEETPEIRASLDHYLACCKTLGAAGVAAHIDKMLALDYLLANHDRHLRNFGLIRNVNDLTWRVAPLFDNGSSLWCNKLPLRDSDLTYQSQPFVYDPELQLELINDLSWFKPEALFGFIDFAIEMLRSGPLQTYAMRLALIEDALYERLDRLIDLC